MIASLPPQRPHLAPDVFDMDAALDRLGGDRRVLASLISHLLTDHATVGMQLERDFAAGCPEDALAEAHTLAGAAGNLGLLCLHRDARAVVTAVRRGEPPQSTINTLQQTMDGLLEHWQVIMDMLAVGEAHQTDSAQRRGPDEPANHTGAEDPPVPAADRLAPLLQALADRDFASVDLYGAVRPWLSRHAPQAVQDLDHAMDLLNFKHAHALLAPLVERS